MQKEERYVETAVTAYWNGDVGLTCGPT